MATNNAVNSIAGSVITKFTGSGTWTPNSRTQSVYVILWNGGGGGGGGALQATGVSGGGGGGANGGVVTFSASRNYFGASETVTIGAGGTGGAAILSSNANGNPGGLCGQSALGNITITASATAALGGRSALGTGGVASVSAYWEVGNTQITLGAGANGSQAGNGVTIPTIPGTFGMASSVGTSTGGGGGGGGTTAGGNTGSAGGSIFQLGVVLTNSVSAGGTLGAAGSAGGPGASGIATGGLILGGTGGGGGGGGTGSVNGGTGGLGGTPAAGGGGGGGAVTAGTAVSGAGGNGGNGQVWVIEYF